MHQLRNVRKVISTALEDSFTLSLTWYTGFLKKGTRSPLSRATRYEEQRALTYDVGKLYLGCNQKCLKKWIIT